MINPFKKSYNPEEITLFRFLGRIKLFEQLSYPELSLIAPYLHLREYKQDEAIFFRDDPSHALYIIKSGKVSLNIDIEGKLELLKVIKTGEAVGLNSLLKNTHRIYSTVVVSEIAELYVMPQVNIHDIFNANLKVKAKMLESMSGMYDEFHRNLFKAYKTSFGFFNLSQVYQFNEGPQVP